MYGFDLANPQPKNGKIPGSTDGMQFITHDMAVNAIMKADDTVQARIKKEKIDMMVTNAQTEIKKAKTAMQTILNSNNKNYGANFKTANNAFGAMSIVHRSWENIYEKINAIKGGRRRRTHRKRKQRTHRKHRR
jgi:hypothetical protein